MNTLIPGAPLRSLSPTTNEYQRAQGESRAAKPARAARFTLDAPSVEERGDFGSAFRATAVVILAPNEKGGPYREGVVSVTRVTCTRSS